MAHIQFWLNTEAGDGPFRWWMLDDGVERLVKSITIDVPVQTVGARFTCEGNYTESGGDVAVYPTKAESVPQSLSQRLGMSESFPRIALRMVTWRIGGIIVAVVIGWWLTGDWVLGLQFGLAYNLVRGLTQLVHDSVWSRMKWGRDVGGN